MGPPGRLVEARPNDRTRNVPRRKAICSVPVVRGEGGEQPVRGAADRDGMIDLVPVPSGDGSFTLTVSWCTPAGAEAARQVVADTLAAAAAAGLPVMLERPPSPGDGREPSDGGDAPPTLPRR